MKKTLALVLALIMVLSISAYCFAASVSIGSPTPIVPEIHRAWEYDTKTDEWVEIDLDADGYLKLVVTPYEKRYTPNTVIEGVPPYILNHLEDAYAYRDECIPLASDYTGIPEEKLAIASIFDITWEYLPKDIYGLRIELTGFNEDNFVCLLHKNHVDEYHNLGEDWFVEEGAYMRGPYLYIDTPHLSSFAVIVNKDIVPEDDDPSHGGGTSHVDIDGRETESPVTGSASAVSAFAAAVIVGSVAGVFAISKRKEEK